MRIVFFVLLIAPLLTFAQPGKLPKFKEKKSEIIFLRKVEDALRTHDADEMMMYIEPEYKRQQHDEFLEGRTLQFLSELFFCPNVAFNQITVAHLMACRQNGSDPNLLEAEFYISSSSVNCTITVTVVKHAETRVFSLVGAMG